MSFKLAEASRGVIGVELHIFISDLAGGWTTRRGQRDSHALMDLLRDGISVSHLSLAWGQWYTGSCNAMWLPGFRSQ